MSDISTSFDSFAQSYNSQMGSQGDYCHKTLIDPALFDCCQSLEQKIIYDIGCGNGYLDRKFVEKGAKEVIATDISKNLIDIAQSTHNSSQIKYLVQNGADFKDIPKNYFDLVTLNMSIHYIESLHDLALNIKNVLKPSGRVAFTTTHPMNTQRLHRQDLIQKNEISGADIQKVAERYLYPYEDEIDWGDISKLKIFYRPISTYIQTFTKIGFCLDTFIETPTAYPIKFMGFGFRQIVTSNVPMFMGFGFAKKD